MKKLLPTKEGLLTAADLKNIIKKRMRKRGDLVEICKELGLKLPRLYNILYSERPITDKIANLMGYQKVYIKKEGSSEQ
jgi:hypothetical protein